MFSWASAYVRAGHIPRGTDEQTTEVLEGRGRTKERNQGDGGGQHGVAGKTFSCHKPKRYHPRREAFSCGHMEIQ